MPPVTAEQKPREGSRPESDDSKTPEAISDTPKDEAGTLPLHERRTRRTSASMVIICVLLVLYTVYFARTILMPMVAAIILSLLLRPAIRACRKYRIPDALSAAGVLLIVVVICMAVIANLVGPAREWVNDAPEKFRDIGERLHVIREQVEELNEAREAVEDMAEGDADEVETPDAPYPFAADTDSTLTENETKETDAARTSLPNDGVPREDNGLEQANQKAEFNEPVQVQIQQPRLISGIQMLTSTGSWVGGVLAEIFLMLVLCYFLLASGDILINNVLRILPSRKEKRTTVELVHTVEKGISSYLVTVTVINICLGIAIAAAMWLLGLPNPVLWGAMATLFNFVPFLGAMFGTIVVFLVSILSFESLAYAFLPPIVYWSITALEGNFITPHVIGRSMSLNPIMVFLSLSIWGWMWGVGGALLAVPILAVLKVGFDQFERTKALGTLLGGSSSV